MSAWLSRNAAPIALVALAAGLVVGLFEVLDALAGTVAASDDADEAELTGFASLAGLVKVAIFLAAGALLVRPLRRRLSGSRDGSVDDRE